MTAIVFEGGTPQIDAAMVAEALNITPEDLRRQMREGHVTSRFERGEGEDSGRFRVTFFSQHRRFRLTVDATGAVLHRSTIDLGSARLRP